MSEKIHVTSDISSNIVNEFDLMGGQIVKLLKSKLTGATVYYGYRPFGATDISYPCYMVEPISQKAFMRTTGKYDVHLNFYVYFYVVETNLDSLIRLQTYVAEVIMALFTNGFYKSNSPYWADSQMTEMYLSGNFKNATPQGGASYMRAGRLSLELIDVVVKGMGAQDFLAAEEGGRIILEGITQP